MEDNEDFNMDHIFFGTKMILMDVMDGETFEMEGYEEQITEENIKKALSRSKPSEEYDDLVVPEIPAVDLKMKVANDTNKFPELLRKPLIKKKDGKIVAFTSGIRSAIVKTNEGRYYRLKGCGNNYDLFPLREVESNKEWKGFFSL